MVPVFFEPSGSVISHFTPPTGLPSLSSSVTATSFGPGGVSFAASAPPAALLPSAPPAASPPALSPEPVAPSVEEPVAPPSLALVQSVPSTPPAPALPAASAAASLAACSALEATSLERSPPAPPITAFAAAAAAAAAASCCASVAPAAAAAARAAAASAAATSAARSSEGGFRLTLSAFMFICGPALNPAFCATFRSNADPMSSLPVFLVLISRSSHCRTIFFSAWNSTSPSLASMRNFLSFTFQVTERFPDLSAMTIFSSPSLS